MKIGLLFLGLFAIPVCASAADFNRGAAFDSVADFVAAAKAFQPAVNKGDLAALFTAREIGQPEDPETGTPVVAVAIRSSAQLWSDDGHALVFVTAAPPIAATRCCVGALFVLSHESGSWRVADVLRFCATGKDAEVSAELTAGTGTSYHLGDAGMAPVITIKESQGGRGYEYQSSASYTVNASKLKRLELN